MKRNYYSIYDTAAAMYRPPFLLVTDAQAAREFSDAFNSENPISAHPEHYYLVSLGTFDDSNAKFETHAPITLLTGLEALALANKAGADQDDMFDKETSPGGTD